MKTLRALIVTAAAALALTGAASAAHTSASMISARPSFYSGYEFLAISYVIGDNPACVPDEFGGYPLEGCVYIAQNMADWDVRVWQTYPTRRFVYADRGLGLSGHASSYLLWQLDLQAPDCYAGPGWQRRYRAVVRLFSPVTGRAVATDSVFFGAHCR
jgi:hypothetical protein